MREKQSDTDEENTILPSGLSLVKEVGFEASSAQRFFPLDLNLGSDTSN